MLVLFCALAPGCMGPSAYDRSEAGKAMVRTAGIPNFDIECIPAVIDTLPSLDLYLVIYRTSLSYAKTPEGYEARAEVDVRILERTGRSPVRDMMWIDTSRVEDFESTYSHLPIEIQRRMIVPSGSFVIEVRVTDATTKKSGVRNQTVVVPEVSGRMMSAGKVVLRSVDARGNGIPVVVNDVAAGSDSLEAMAEVYSTHAGQPLDAEIMVVRIVTDSSAAISPLTLSFTSVPFGHGRAAFSNLDTVLTTHQEAMSKGRTVQFACRLDSLRQGLHRIEFTIHVGETAGTGRDTVLRISRSFSVRGRGFPRPTTLPDLIGPLTYIANRMEMRPLVVARTPEGQRREFDRFWLSLIKDPKVASTMIRNYYGRVEEANKLFTTYKEGWKTDRGMVYVILGPPLRIDKEYGRETWYYNLSNDADANTFLFKRNVYEGGGYSFEEYILNRTGLYGVLWQRMVARLRSGEFW